ncbi:MAG TPA: M1 family aminopeptidase [Trebonia sp.]|jgi:aminopeptidase N|nr:M1 family aminopeptidase [Trebonia sp.]
MMMLMLDSTSIHAHARSSVLTVVSYDLELDFNGGPDTFSSRAEIRFRANRPGVSSFADLLAAGVRRAVLNGVRLDSGASCHDGHLPLPDLARENLLVVEADMYYTTAEAGLHRVREANGSDCVYGKGYPDGARRIYCCFDQEDLRAPFTVSINAPAGWSCLANGPLASRPAGDAAGAWRFAATQPLAPFLSSFCAGNYASSAFSCPRDDEPPVPVTVNARPAMRESVNTLLRPELVSGPLRYYERVLAAAYPYLKCDLVFVPRYRPLAYGAPGLMTIQEQVLAKAADDTSGLYLAVVLAHELAHAWFGGMFCTYESDGWLIEALTTYLSRRALGELHPGIDPWDASLSTELPDHAYGEYAAPVRQLAELIGTQAVLDGLTGLMRDRPHACVTKGDVVRSWSRAAGRDLRAWAAETLVPAVG